VFIATENLQNKLIKLTKLQLTLTATPTN